MWVVLPQPGTSGPNGCHYPSVSVMPRDCSASPHALVTPHPVLVTPHSATHTNPSLCPCPPAVPASAAAPFSQPLCLVASSTIMSSRSDTHTNTSLAPSLLPVPASAAGSPLPLCVSLHPAPSCHLARARAHRHTQPHTQTPPSVPACLLFPPPPPPPCPPPSLTASRTILSSCSREHTHS